MISRDTGLEDSDYKWGFTIDIESDVAPKGLNEEIVRFISAKKGEPDWMLEWRLRSYRHWLSLNYEEPKWANLHHSPIDYQDIIYYAAPTSKADGPKSLGEVDPELVAAFDKLGIPIESRKSSLGGRGRSPGQRLRGPPPIRRPWTSTVLSSALSPRRCRKHPELVKKYLGSVVPYTDNFYAT